MHSSIQNTTVRRRGDSARRQEDASVPAPGRAGPGHWPQSRRSRVPHTPPKICAVGSSNMDLISRVPHLPRLGETIVGHSFHMGYGGKGANQAVMAAKLRAQVTLVTKLGRDVFGEGLLANYRQQGVDTTYVFFDDERGSGVAPIFVDDNAQNFIVIVPGANMGLSPADVRRSTPAVQAANVLICQLEIPVETTLEAFRIAKAAKATTILNPAPAAALPDELLRLCDLCVPNETETESLTGRPATTVEEAAVAGRILLRRGPRVVIITLGARGALVLAAGTPGDATSIRVYAGDPTGSGDAFVGRPA